MGYLVADLARMFTHSKDVKHRGLFDPLFGADAGVLAHALYILFQLFLCHLLVMELEASLAVYQANLAVLEADEVQEAPEVVDLVDQRNFSQDHQRK